MLVSTQLIPSYRHKLYFSVLGGFALKDIDGRHIAIANRKACGLLAYVVLNHEMTETRERLAGLLWSDRGEEQARASLRQALRQLRKTFEELDFDGFRTERQDIVLDGNCVRVDLQEIWDQLNAGVVDQRILSADGVPERILYGYEGLDQSFSNWLQVLRQNWQGRLVDKLSGHLNSSDQQFAKNASEALLTIDPTHELAHRHLIRHHADAGNTAAALNQYKILWDLLGEEYDTEPDEETQRLIAEIKVGQYNASIGNGQEKLPTQAAVRAGDQVDDETRTDGKSLHHLPVICVQSFSQAGPWLSEDYLIYGFRRDLIAALVRFREWVVVERNVNDGLSDQIEDAGVSDYFLKGSYYEENSKIHIVVTLRDEAQSRYVWSEKLELELGNWFSICSTIIRKLAIALNIYLSVDRLQRTLPNSPLSADVYGRWLLGQELSFRWRPDDEQRAEDIFHSIIEQSPDFAPAYSSLAQIKNSRHHVFPGKYRSSTQHAEALEFARVAVKKDPLDCRSQLCLAWSYAMNGMYDKAVLNYHIARELNENDPWVLVSTSLGLAYCDQLDESAELADQSIAVGLNSSRLHWAYRAGVYFMLGKYDACIEAADYAEDAIYYVSAWKASALAHLDRIPEAEAEAAHFQDLVRDNWFGREQPTRSEVARWLLHCFPIRRKDTWERLRDGLGRAGLSAQ